MKNEWDKFANKYNSQVGRAGDIYHRTYLNPIIWKMLGNARGKKILDLGCGNGYFSNLLARKGANVIGVDYSKELINFANSNKIKNTEFIVGDASNLKFLNDKSFDEIISNVAFQDIKKIDKTIKECSRILKHDGRLIFSMLHPVFRITKKEKDSEGYFRKIRKYISAVKYKTSDKTTLYNRPISFYMKNLFENDFVVTDFKEIVTKHLKGEKIKDKEVLKHKLEIPTFLIFEAKKE